MDKITNFSDMNLSENTVKALTMMKFIKPTKVQLKTIPICLKERDVIVQAKTGSGKTLAFLIPLVEVLTKMKCNVSCGIQSIILVPTAELALQTVHVLSKLIKFNTQITYLSVVGGKSHSSKKEEWAKINDANIIVSTPGRLLEHQEKNSSLDLSNVKNLIIDETDFMLEETFIEEIEAILKYLPRTRSNWLFSATQCSILKELGRLTLHNPVHIGLEDPTIHFPKNLAQAFMKVELQNKIQALWNLLEAQHKANTIVFFSTQKEVLFFYRLFTALQPGYKIVQLRSNLRLDKRSNAIAELLSSDGGKVLFATDVASRGLDFPNVSLVVHYDLPRDFDYYVHRAGRTARFDSRGTSVLMVMPPEMEFMTLLKTKGVILKKINGNILSSNKKSVSERASIQYALSVELFNIAKSSFLSYVRDYGKRPKSLTENGESFEIFDVEKLPVKLLATSLGFKTVPEDCSTVSHVQPKLDSVEVDDKPFLTVKKKLPSNNKRKLDLSMTNDSDCEEDAEDQIVDVKEEEIPPAIDFEQEFLMLQESSKLDKKYFRTIIEPKYKIKKSKHDKKEAEDDQMEVDEDDQ